PAARAAASAMRRSSRAQAARLCPPAYASRQPRCPQPHNRPLGWTRMCPSSPETPEVPSCSLPARMIPAPTPLPTSTTIRSSTPRPPPATPPARAATPAPRARRALAPGGHREVVPDPHRQPRRPRLHQLEERHLVPAEVRGVHHHPRALLDPPGHAHAHPLHLAERQ